MDNYGGFYEKGVARESASGDLWGRWGKFTDSSLFVGIALV